jgi:lysozyme
VGVGHLCVEDFWEDDKEYEEKFLMTILEHDLQTAIKSAKQLIEEFGCDDIDEQAEEILIEMVFQLGKTGVSKFKNMWKALAEKNYIGASYEMLDSRWAKQTPNRAKAMADLMKACV